MSSWPSGQVTSVSNSPRKYSMRHLTAIVCRYVHGSTDCCLSCCAWGLPSRSLLISMWSSSQTVSVKLMMPRWNRQDSPKSEPLATWTHMYRWSMRQLIMNTQCRYHSRPATHLTSLKLDVDRISLFRESFFQELPQFLPFELVRGDSLLIEVFLTCWGGSGSPYRLQEAGSPPPWRCWIAPPGGHGCGWIWGSAVKGLRRTWNSWIIGYNSNIKGPDSSTEDTSLGINFRPALWRSSEQAMAAFWASKSCRVIRSHLGSKLTPRYLPNHLCSSPMAQEPETQVKKEMLPWEHQNPKTYLNLTSDFIFADCSISQNHLRYSNQQCRALNLENNFFDIVQIILLEVWWVFDELTTLPFFTRAARPIPATT